MRRLPAAVAAAVAVLAMAALSGVALAGDHHGDHGSHGRKGPASASVQATITSSSQAGVKPSSTTAHDTDAAAGSDQTKLYGNGKTAGQVAIGKGASSDTDLHGPGNSQPHKICGRDVHAFKGGDCSTQGQASTKSQEQLQAPTTTTTSSPGKVFICHSTGSATNPFVLIEVSVAAEHAHVQHHHGADVVLGASPGPCPTASQQQQLNAAAAATTTTTPVTTTVQTTTTTAAAVTTTPSTTSGVKGASKTLSGQAAGAPSSGVLGTAKTLGRTATTGTLPFTGLRLWIVELIALGLIGGGVAMRLIARRRIN